METDAAGAGWQVGQSAALEVATALAISSGSGAILAASDSLAALVQPLPAEWRAEWAALLGEARGGAEVIEYLAALAGVLREPDYSRATLAMRELTLAAALARATEQAAPYGLAPTATLPPPVRLADLLRRLTGAVYTAVGMSPQVEWLRRQEQAVQRLPDLLRDGDRHTRFWHWMDRFYYEYYRPWRAGRATVVETLEKQALAVLGAREKHGVAPALAWLPPQSPLLRYPPLAAAVQDGRAGVFFWAEPFGLIDSWSAWPGLITVSFAPGGALFEQFRTYTAAIAAHAAALGDPTRLIILRLIRYFGMVNSEIAGYLGLTQATVSVHVKILREAGLIRSQAVGRQVHHELVPGELRRLFRDLERYLDLPEAEDEPG